MLIRKLFKFENVHIVRNCSSERCKHSIDGYSYQTDLILEAKRLDHGQMVYDFGLLKSSIKDIIDSFEHGICFWNKDDPELYAKLIRGESFVNPSVTMQVQAKVQEGNSDV